MNQAVGANTHFQQVISLIEGKETEAALPIGSSLGIRPDVGEITKKASMEYLGERAHVLSKYLRAHGLAGKQVWLVYPPGPDFVATYLACLRVSVIPLPLWPSEKDADAFVCGLESSKEEPLVVLTLAEQVPHLERAVERRSRGSLLRCVATDTLPEEPWEPNEFRQSAPASPAMSSYVPLWRQSAPRPLFESARALNWLFFVDDHGLVSELVERMRRLPDDLEPNVSLVRPGDGFERVDEGLYTIDPACPGNYASLIADLVQQRRAPDYILHGWTLTGPELDMGVPLLSTCDFSTHFREEQARLTAHRVNSFHSLEFLAYGLQAHLEPGPLHLTVLSNDLHRVTVEDVVDADKAFLLGAIRELPRCRPDLVCRNIDFRLPRFLEAGRKTDLDRLVLDLLSEIVPSAEDLEESVVALRGDSRWVQHYGPLCFKGESGSGNRLREGGVYLITGGLEGAGFPLAQELSLMARPRLILLSGTEIPERNTWDAWVQEHGESDHTSRSIFKLCELEEAGAEVLVLTADLNDPIDLEVAISRAEERFGPLHGVIHCAEERSQRFPASYSVGKAKSVGLEARVESTLLLDCLLRGRPLDFFVLFSLARAEKSESGSLKRAATNAFLGAFAQSRFSRTGTLVTAIDWDCESEIESAGELEELRSKLPAREMFDVFRRVLDMGGVSQVVVSTGGNLMKGKG